MDNFFSMGGYAGFVWSSYAVFFVVLAIDTIAPMLQRRRALKDLQSRVRRQAAKKSS